MLIISYWVASSRRATCVSIWTPLQSSQHPSYAPSQRRAAMVNIFIGDPPGLHGALASLVPHGNPLFRTLTLCPACGQPRRRSDERVYVRKSGPKVQVARPGLEYGVSTAPKTARQGEVRLVTERHCTRASNNAADTRQSAIPR